MRAAACVCTAGAGVLLAAGVTACVEIGTAPNAPAAIELEPFASPSIVVGDTLRDANGALARINAIVRNVRGEVITDAPVRFVYADFTRDSALQVDSASGLVLAVRPATGEARIAARVGNSLQVLRTLIVTVQPDFMTVARDTAAVLVTALPDTARLNDNPNISEPLNVLVRHNLESTTTGVNAWLVRFRILSPANPSNDSSAAVFLVNTAGRPSALDTTDASGTATRRVRVRAAQFPAGASDVVVVEATTTYRGRNIVGSPDTIYVPVRRGTGTP